MDGRTDLRTRWNRTSVCRPVLGKSPYGAIMTNVSQNPNHLNYQWHIIFQISLLAVPRVWSTVDLVSEQAGVHLHGILG